jgi:uncharacterized protein YceK
MKISACLLKKMTNIVLFSLVAGMATGCASIVSGHTQSVSVSTDPVKNATCTLENNKGTWYVPSTPGSVTVNRSFENLSVECKKQGYPKSHKSIASSTKALVAGNILFGGIIGGGVDVATGAAYDYPQEIRVPIERA